MKCPKCGYVGFERADRCRNCGYDFSLSTAASGEFDPELRIRTDPPAVDHLPEVALLRDHTPSEPEAPGAAPYGRTAAGRAVSTGRTPPDLPLFGGPVLDDEPLITRPS